MAKVLENGEYKNQVVVKGAEYLGEETIAMDGASKVATLPNRANVIEIAAEDGDVRYSINGVASANSGGYVLSGQKGYVFKLANLASLALFGLAGAKAHLLYYEEP